MDKGRIEDKIKDRLENHTVHIDKNELWNNIQPQKKKRRFPIVWIFGLVLLLVSFFVLNNCNFFSSEEVAPDVFLEKGETPIDVDRTITYKDQVAKDRTHEEINSEEVPAYNSHALESLKTNTDTDKENLRNPITSSHINSGILYNHQTTTHLKDANTIPKPIAAQPKANVSEAAFSPLKEEENRNLEHDVSLIKKIAAADPTIIEKRVTVNSEEVKPDVQDVVANELISSPAKEQIIEKEAIDKMDDKAQDVLPENHVKENSTPQFFGGLDIGYGWVSHSLSANDRSTAEWVDKRRKAITPLENISMGLHFGKFFYDNFYASFGIQMNRRQEEFIATDLRMDTITENGILYYLVDKNGSQTNENGLVQKTTEQNIHYKVYNTYTRWDVPLSMGYRKKFSRWAIGSEVGIRFNLHHSFKGYNYQKDLTIAEDPDIFVSRTGIQFQLGLQVDYFMKANHSIYINPSYRFNKVNLSPNVTVEKKVGLSSIVLGYRYYFK